MRNNHELSDKINCSFCGLKFSADKAETACKGCPLVRGCKLVRCPNCGYEIPITPKWLRPRKSRPRTQEPIAS